ncbi:autotransporter-associated beta strand protein [Roseimicrobium gellanilyticum]|uniref:Autotransporter-associated beta strand protein n=1 Tax=Roseimicrobium gellanilyticum TaxID=748857 RepID=A0A366HI29_9BACT|nr:autotransporter-associated beta strand repeat-containing protein [Roseimicrobium gellanilyticum]RBP42406.1 autotransporter-associated beta strand protein [Roseimicrobium gellanilyticum]
MARLSLCRPFLRIASLAAIFSFSCLTWVQGVDVTWKGTTNVWGTATNWTSDPTLPTASDRVIFGNAGASLSINTGEDRFVGGVLFNGSGSYAINVNVGVLYVGNQGIEVTSGTQNFNSGNVRLNAPGDTTILNNGTLNFNNGIMYHRTSGSGNKVLTFDGSGNTTVARFERRSNTYDMSLIKNGSGTLTISGSAAGPAGSNAAGAITGSTTINAGKVRINAEANLGGDAAAFNAGLLTLNGGTLGAFASFTIDDANRGVTLGSSGGTFDVETGFTLTVANVITGTGGLAKTGAGTLVLSGVNTYAGLTTVTAGILNVQGNSALGTADAGTVVSSGTTLQVQGNIDLGAEALTLSGVGVTGQAGALVNVSGTNIIGGALTLGADTTIASLAGQLNLTSTAAVVGNNSVLTLTGAGNGSLSGAMDASVKSLTKSGAGNWILNGANTYTGATTVTNGTLTIGSAGSLGNTEVTVQTGATFNVLGTTGTSEVSVQTGGTLAGSGTMGGAVTLVNGSTLSAGDSLVAGSTGTLSIGGGLSLANETSLNFNLGTDSDRVAVTGNLLLNGVLRIHQGVGFGEASSYTLFSYTGTLADAGLALAGPLSGYNYSITSGAGQVNLQVNQTGLQFWDGGNTSQNGSIDGGPGIWSNVAGNTNWTNGTGSTNAAWSAGQTAVFLGTPGDVQVADTIAVGGLQFGSSYNLVDAGGNVGKLAITAAATEVRVDPSITANIGVAITGTGGINKTSTGTLVLSAVSNYTGATTVREGTLKIGVNNALPTGTALTIGSDGLAAHLDASTASLTVGSLHVASNVSATSTVTIGAGQTLSVTGSGGFKVGVAGTYKVKTNATFSGGGSLVVNNTAANFEAGIQPNTSMTVGPGGDPTFDGASNANTTVVDMTGLSSVTANVNNFRVGFGMNNATTLNLSNTANSITANAIQISHSDGRNAQASTLFLGGGTNVLLTDNLEIGISKGVGTLKFLSAAGTVEIRGKSGAATNITLGATGDTITAAGPSGTLDLSGHMATVVANNLVMGSRTTTSGAATGVLNFGGGTFTVNNVDMGILTVGTSSTINTTLNISGGTFTVNAGGAFRMATFSSPAATGRVNATVNITGGTLVSNVDIVEVGGTNATTGNTNTVIKLDGGTLDMTGHNIGSAANTINTLTLASGTLKDTGEINGGAAISKTTTGMLVMQGNNAYSGATTVSAGTLLVNNTYTGTSSATGSNTVTVNGGTTFGGNGRVAGPVTVNTSATLAPGGNATTIANGVSGLNTDVGTLKIDNNLTVSTGANLALQIKTDGTHGLTVTRDAVTKMLTSVSGTSEDGGNDRLLITGDISLHSGAKITVTLAAGYNATSGSVFDLLDWASVNGGSAIDSAFYDFAGNGRRTGADNQAFGLILPDVTVLGSDYFWDVSRFGSSGTISLVPEPGRALLFMVGLGALLLPRRRRR